LQPVSFAERGNNRVALSAINYNG